ncbi:hypothetical protein AALC25_06810 [Lachnospiraceae bacterium 29-84]
MKTLYLHIGTPKTASTAIQDFCWENQQVLNSKGYYYPDMELRFPEIRYVRNAHFLIGQNQIPKSDRDFEKERETVDKCFAKLYASFQKYDNIILTDESMWHYGFGYEGMGWDRIKKELEKGIFSLKVIVYLRRQDDFIFSWWNQMVKEGFHRSSVITWETMAKKRPVVKLDYYKMLDRIAAFAGKENITVRLFDRKKFVGQTIQADFLDAIGLTLSEEYQMPEDFSNTSLTKNYIEIKRILNELPGLDKKSNAWFRKHATDCSLDSGNDKKYHIFSKDEMEAFLAEYEEGNRKIAQEYLGSDTLFDNTYRAEGKWSPDNPYMWEDTVKFFGSIMNQLIAETEALKHETAISTRQLNALKRLLRHPLDTVGRKLKNKLSNPPQ